MMGASGIKGAATLTILHGRAVFAYTVPLGDSGATLKPNPPLPLVHTAQLTTDPKHAS